MKDRKQQLKLSMPQKEVDRRARLLRAQVGDILLKENIFGELYVSFKANQSKDVVQVFETENLTDFDPPRVDTDLSPNNYLFVVYNGKSPHAVRSTLRDAGYISVDRDSPCYNMYWGIV